MEYQDYECGTTNRSGEWNPDALLNSQEFSRDQSSKPKLSAWARFFSTMNVHFHDIYQPDGVEVIFNKNVINSDDSKKRDVSEIQIDGKGLTYVFKTKQMEQYCRDPRTILSYFLGLPNHPDGTLKQSWANLFYNLIGWETRNTKWRTFNNFFFPVFLLLNLIAVPFKALLNIAKLFTELLPNLAYSYSSRLFNEAKNEPISYKPGKYLWRLGKIIFYFFLGAFVFSLRTLGFATTSPIKSVKQAWHFGNSKEVIDHLPDDIQRLAAPLFAGLSILLTVSAYAALFPLVIQPIAASLLPYLATHLPAGIITIVNVVAAIVSPVLTVIGIVASPIIAITLKIMTFGALHGLMVGTAIAMSPSLAAIGLFTGLAVTTVGIKLSEIYSRAKHSYNEVVTTNGEDNSILSGVTKVVAILKGYSPFKDNNFARSGAQVLEEQSEEDNQRVYEPGPSENRNHTPSLSSSSGNSTEDDTPQDDTKFNL